MLRDFGNDQDFRNLGLHHSVYVWNPDPTLIGNNIPNPVVFPTTTTSYTVTVTDANGCVNTDITTVTVNPLPIVEAGNDTAKCGEVGVMLTATGGVSYQWTPIQGLSDPTIANPIANPDSSDWSDLAFSEYCTEPGDKAHSDGDKIWQNRMVREGDWKLVYYHGMPSQLFNLADDESEENNLAKSNPEQLQKMIRVAQQNRSPSKLFPSPFDQD